MVSDDESTGQEQRTPGGPGAPEAPRASAPAGPEGSPRRGGNAQDKGQRALLFVGIAVLAVILLGCTFALGYYMGDQNATIHGLVKGRPQVGSVPGEPGLQAPGAQGQQEPGQQGPGERVRQRVQEMLQDPDNSLVRGTVASVQDGTVTVETQSGQESVKVTEQTRVLGGGKAGAGTGSLATGDGVTIIARRGADGSLEAIAIRKTGTGEGQQRQGL